MEPVIEKFSDVPKISLLSLAPRRSLLGAPQTAELLVEVHTPQLDHCQVCTRPHQQYHRRLLQEFLLGDDDREKNTPATMVSR